MQGQAAANAAGYANGLVFSPLELTLMSIAFTILGGIIIGVVSRYISSSRYVSKAECEARHKHDCQYNAETSRQIEALKQQQTRVQEKSDEKIHIIFRMVRGLVVYSEISPENKEKILNARGRDA